MKYKNGDIVVAKVHSIGLKYVNLWTKNATKFLILHEEVSDFKGKKIYDIFKIGDIVNFVCLSFNEEKNEGYGSYKLNHHRELKTKFSYKLKETPNGFNNLINFFNGEINDCQKECCIDNKTVCQK
ncbi:small subunit ribosomal protein S1 [Mycoplasmopsis mustelae]|uniref:Small subunit ribosomal protein S1 n=1 Tax=Mycoplasmopsis mustelae TaxID=171289 RepID=A0A4R7UC24_9BACT|nr:RNA-binding protein [Mycoplasmopsis mustelae]TDV23277.1 small subunit ribosomal protein S1 [Mycoplasmopsis mustelae]